ncbi:hypothetical protein T11_897 [Trichinella zimbabwensis]|uniref:Uncharacterized protein n=1 Tax=Trichinella zimbabwensis TaxID=268475 RepID=A0A0V1G788_9BILA|nr:hypothetical protein T11_897 [Trichinella zimbabwensis]
MIGWGEKAGNNLQRRSTGITVLCVEILTKE